MKAASSIGDLDFYQPQRLQHQVTALSHPTLHDGRDISMQDVQALVRALHGYQSELERQHDELRRLQTVLDALVEGMGHHFNDILTVMLGFTDLALGRLPPDHPVNVHLREVLIAGQRAKELVIQLSTYRGGNLAQRRLLSGAALLRDVLAWWRPSLPSSVQLRQHLPEDVGIMLVDPAKMQQALLRLLENAADAVRETGGVVEVQAAAVEVDGAFAVRHAPRQLGPYVRVAIRDTGTGMPPEVMARACEPFFTTKRHATGMGLAVAQGIVTSHGGTMTLESTVQVGTTATIYLPAQPSGASV
jgi:signal transduction histidine kinase